MGRKTYESIGKPLDGRDNIVVTRQNNFNPPGRSCRGIPLPRHLRSGALLAGKRGVDEVMVIGGAEVFGAACR